MCIIPGCGLELEHAILHEFLPTVFCVEISTVKYNLFALPLRFGGLGVTILICWLLVSLAPFLFVTFVNFIVGAATSELGAHLESVSDAKMYHQKCMPKISIHCYLLLIHLINVLF